MNKEVLFAQTLEQIKALAREQGNCVSEAQVEEAFAPLDMNSDQLQLVYDYLVKHKVGIGEPVNLDDYLTNEERNYLQDYLDELAQLKDYSSGEKEACTISAMAGDGQAQARLIEMYLKEVVEIARLYAGQGVYMEDLIGEGNLALTFGCGMLGGAESPKEVQGMLAQLIMDSMERHIQENASAEKTDQRVVDKVNKVMEKAKELSEELQRKITVEELAGETGMTEKAIREAMRMSGHRIEYIEGDDHA